MRKNVVDGKAAHASSGAARRRLRRIALTTALLGAVAALVAPAAGASRNLLVGIYDEPSTLGNPNWAFPQYKALRVKVLRVNLYWGGPTGVATKKPAQAINPADPAYNWSIYDETVKRAQANGIKMVFSILWTPRWAGPAKNQPPRRMSDLRNFSYAAAKRYSGSFRVIPDAEPLPAVRHWMAWNEPNNPVFLFPQFKRVGGKYVLWSPRIYTQMCNAIYSGVHLTGFSGEKVACGVTAPRGNNTARQARASVSPLYFAAGMKRNRARYDAYAHHPYYGKRFETPTSRPTKKGSTAVILGNLGDLQKVIGRSRRIWITEYGYQTPPERIFGVSFAQQARYVAQSFAIARRNPRVDMMLWFLLKDERRISNGWQSGFFKANGAKKPSFRAFQRVRK